MAKKMIAAPVAMPASDQKWERRYAQRQHQREFTEEANKAFEKSDAILRVGHGNDDERLAPIVPGPFRVGCFKKQ